MNEEIHSIRCKDVCNQQHFISFHCQIIRVGSYDMTHAFQLIDMFLTVECGICEATLIGFLDEAFECINCGLKVDKSCRSKANASVPCQKLQVLQKHDQNSTRNHISNSHHFTEKTFFEPTTCNLCNSMLLGFYKQGFECDLCACTVHGDCRNRAIQSIPCRNFADNNTPSSIMKLKTNSCAHYFVVVRLTDPTPCTFCNNVISPEHSCVQCSHCKNIAHTACTPHVTESTLDDASGTQSAHHQAPRRTSTNDGVPESWLEQQFSDEIEDWKEGYSKMERDLSAKFDAWSTQWSVKMEKSLTEQAEKLDKSMQRIEDDGIAVTIARGIKNTGDSIRRGMNAIADQVETAPKGEHVEVDEDVLHATELAKEAAGALGNASIKLWEGMKEFSVYAAEQYYNSEFGQSAEGQIDPEVSKSSREILAAIGLIWDTSRNTIYEVAGSAGETVSRVARHKYGDDVGLATANTVQAAGNTMRTVSTVTGVASGSILVAAAVRSAPDWKLAKETVFSQCMYREVFEELGYTVNLVSLKRDTEVQLERIKNEVIEHAKDFELETTKND